MTATARGNPAGRSVVSPAVKVTSPVIGICVALALGTSACSSGGHHSSRSAPSTTTVSDTQTARDLGNCPASYPQDSLPTLNAAVKGLDRELVPITARRVLVCAYAGVDRGRVGMGRLLPAIAVPFEQETNAMSRDTLPPPACPAPMPSEPSYLLVFANDAQRVLVETPAGCSGPTNGVFEANETERWHDEVVIYSGQP